MGPRTLSARLPQAKKDEPKVETHSSSMTMSRNDKLKFNSIP